jgi:hypothetical protein
MSGLTQLTNLATNTTNCIAPTSMFSEPLFNGQFEVH